MGDLDMLRHIDLETWRQLYAEELRAVANLRSAALIQAFARVPREQFLGPGPWQVVAPGEPGDVSYRTTEDADPRHLYHNVLVAIDASRRLNNGQPSSLAFWFDSLELQKGEHVVHIGCGVGYYTAILAEVVGPSGHVTAIEIEPALAARAGRNLSHLPHVEVVEADGGVYAPGPSGAIFVNAGATHPCLVWLNALRPGGRLLVPLTVASDPSSLGRGGMLKITRQPRGLTACFISEVGIFPCIGVRDAELNAELQEAFRRPAWKALQSLRCDVHERSDACWLHTQEFCLSTAALALDACR